MTETVQILNASGVPVLQNAVPVKVGVIRPSKSFEHPVEDGSTIVDGKVVTPVEISYSVVLKPENYKDVYRQVERYFLNNDFFSVQTKAGVFGKMYLTGIPHEEAPDMFNTIPMTLSFKEAMIAVSQLVKLPITETKDESDASTQDRGEVEGKSASVLTGFIFGSAGN